MDTKELIEVYKISRSSIEHFDKILGDFRKIIFAFNGIVISTGFALYANHSDRFILFFLSSVILGGINILIWLLEKHYHRYLVTASSVALNIEKELFRGKTQRALTYLLDRARRVDLKWEFNRINKLSRFVRSYDLLYLVPILVSIVMNFILSYLSKQPTANPCTFWFFLLSWLIAIGYGVLIYSIIRYEYLFTKKKLNKN